MPWLCAFAMLSVWMPSCCLTAEPAAVDLVHIRIDQRADAAIERVCEVLHEVLLQTDARLGGTQTGGRQVIPS
jgi:hypothetical protein